MNNSVFALKIKNKPNLESIDAIILMMAVLREGLGDREVSELYDEYWEFNKRDHMELSGLIGLLSETELELLTMQQNIDFSYDEIKRADYGFIVEIRENDVHFSMRIHPRIIDLFHCCNEPLIREMLRDNHIGYMNLGYQFP